MMEENLYLKKEEEKSMSHYIVAKVHAAGDKAKDAGSFIMEKGKNVGSAIASTWRRMFRKSTTEL